MTRQAASTPYPKSPPERPLRADAERNRQRLIAAAQEVFAQRGLDVTLDDVARHAGVGVGTAYRRFANRDELIDAVFESTLQRMIGLAEQALSHEDPWEGLVQMFLATGRHFADDRGLREILLEGTGAKDRSAAARERLTPAVGAVIARAQESGRLRDDITPTDVPLIQLMLGAVTQHSRDVRPELWTRYLTLVLDGLRHDRARPTPLPQHALDQDEFDRAMR
ncbi:TetR/AcrR family transcriptional regulator [Streptomyces abyssomicinicus]|uniref:TetR/AcrR family transcriptional regulator n=1 Tax=Streptomyces abyssomicinicus TaxID=574929 RepID=UPI00124F9E79|nr:TetR/AcrR family transcriptional regulator [Streptomyces abyssomicinicus]